MWLVLQAQAATAYAQLQASAGLSSQQLAQQQQLRAGQHFPAVNGSDGASRNSRQQQAAGYAGVPYPQQHQQQAALTRLLQQMNGSTHAAPNTAQAAAAAASAAAAAAQLQVNLLFRARQALLHGMMVPSSMCELDECCLQIRRLMELVIWWSILREDVGAWLLSTATAAQHARCCQQDGIKQNT